MSTLPSSVLLYSVNKLSQFSPSLLEEILGAGFSISSLLRLNDKKLNFSYNKILGIILQLNLIKYEKCYVPVIFLGLAIFV